MWNTNPFPLKVKVVVRCLTWPGPCPGGLPGCASGQGLWAGWAVWSPGGSGWSAVCPGRRCCRAAPPRDGPTPSSSPSAVPGNGRSCVRACSQCLTYIFTWSTVSVVHFLPHSEEPCQSNVLQCTAKKPGSRSRIAKLHYLKKQSADGSSSSTSFSTTLVPWPHDLNWQPTGTKLYFF